MSNNIRSCCSWTSSTSSRGTRSTPPIWPVRPARSGVHPPKAGWIEHDGGPVGDRPPWGRIRIRQRVPVPHGAPDPLRLGRPAGDVRGVALVHGGRRLWPARVLAFRRVGGGQRGALGCAPLLVARPRRSRTLAPVHSLGSASGRPGRAGLPCQLLRGRCVRPLDRHAPPDRVRVGDHRGVARGGRQLPARRLPFDRSTPSEASGRVPMPSSATSGSGPRAPIPPTPGSGPPPAPWASTTASSW